MWWRTALSWTWRLAIVLPPVAAAWVVLWSDGAAGETWGWARAAAWLVPLAVVPTWLLFLRRGDRRWAVGALAVVACALATWLTALAPMGPTRLAEAVAGVDVPGDLVEEHRSTWDVWGSRPGLERTYRTGTDALDALDDLAAELRGDGWSVRVDERWRQLWADRDGVEVVARVRPRTIDLHVTGPS